MPRQGLLGALTAAGRGQWQLDIAPRRVLNQPPVHEDVRRVVPDAARVQLEALGVETRVV